MKLHLHVKTEYFNAVKSGEKTFEFRLLNKYWSDRLINKSYDRIVYYNAYKPGTENRMEFPWRGFHLVEIAHKHFGDQKVKCFAIGLSGSEANTPIASQPPLPCSDGQPVITDGAP